MTRLEEQGVKALFYHAGIKGSERHAIQERFMSGQAEVIVASNAFGMGIDKSDIRFVYHYDVSDSMDAYYQEIGRAGRDGEKAEAVLFFRSQDIGSQAFKTAEGKLRAQQLEEVVDAIADNDGPIQTEEIAEEANLSGRKLSSIIHYLEDVGAVAVLPTGEIEAVENTNPVEAAQAVVEEQEHRRDMKRERLKQMEDYADTSACRREQLLRYFGDVFTGPCGNCDCCEASDSTSGVDPTVGTRREVTFA
jgi:ATP-dependent DNA helicase RecQ